ncbi:MAG: UDP-N-acetylmuramoyl-L-alanyl-D-glutamate--2,6-diaminopimelate ligase [bacterium]|nr:UDP-N-acetylmuramoyl-L-alanyl-D-glutamate--2,6-diaminopimelate ligase [Candidatus Microgenomates bacterium CPR3]MCQ3944563.1 UDP-N-acetylmuramoyl-L-alanyl-D-glutamate--2,6-diaminopimelate ligase [bacterium]RIK51601.1 MAG: UDP-N-acetylmuramoyl-L-alanyl-D-glutamate--2,6-diaminopimelate ligase [Candidatus Microgenomates bacterium]
MLKYRRYLITLLRKLRPLFPQSLVNYFYHLPLAFIASRMYGNPSEGLEIIAVTGTDGKTTTISMIYHILKMAKRKVAMISTVEAKIGKKSFDTGFHVTTPDPFLLQRLLRRIRSQKIRYVVLEVTSHGLDQFRFFPIKPKIAVLTNITHEHLDYHGTYEKYRAAKLRLFKGADHAVINKDQPDFPIINASLPKTLFSTYSLETDSQLKAQDLVESKDSINFRLGRIVYKLPMTGRYNVSNALAAISTALLLEINPVDIKRTLLSFPGVKGRLQEIKNTRGIHAYVDFAHTPNALREVLRNLNNKLGKNEKLIVVFGSAGLRDSSKRPLMGKYAAEFADQIIITSEDPRSEDPKQIASDIMAGMPSSTKRKVVIELDRKLAISRAINEFARSGDWVVSCGKGHEGSMNLDGWTETPWSDQEAMQNALNNN